eukprot:2709962-Rhodomonas_salina.2
MAKPATSDGAAVDTSSFTRDPSGLELGLEETRACTQTSPPASTAPYVRTSHRRATAWHSTGPVQTTLERCEGDPASTSSGGGDLDRSRSGDPDLEPAASTARSVSPGQACRESADTTWAEARWETLLDFEGVHGAAVGEGGRGWRGIRDAWRRGGVGVAACVREGGASLAYQERHRAHARCAAPLRVSLPPRPLAFKSLLRPPSPRQHTRLRAAPGSRVSVLVAPEGVVRAIMMGGKVPAAPPASLPRLPTPPLKHQRGPYSPSHGSRPPGCTVLRFSAGDVVDGSQVGQGCWTWVCEASCVSAGTASWEGSTQRPAQSSSSHLFCGVSVLQVHHRGQADRHMRLGLGPGEELPEAKKPDLQQHA